MTENAGISPQELEAAFARFTEVSAQLESSYQQLQGEVHRLTQELALANGELQRQLDAKEALAARLNTLFEVLPAAVLELDSQQRLQRFNSTAQTWFGLEPPGASTSHAAAPLWPELAAQHLAATGRDDEWQLPAPDGTTQGDLRLKQSLNPIPGGGTLVLLTDMTASHELNRRLEQHQRLAALGEMAAKMAHQLRTPLATAMLYAAQLRDASLPATESRFASKVVERLQHLDTLIAQMLHFVRDARSEAAQRFAVGPLLQEVVALLEPQMQQRDWRVQLAPNLHSVFLLGARNNLLGALVNLLENALQATSAGQIIELQAQCQDQQLCVRLADQGRGMSASVMARMFDPFFTTRPEGTGLGLAIVRQTLLDFGGHIDVQSREEQGTEFCIRLPITPLSTMLDTDRPA